MSEFNIVANVVGAKTARACDSCMRKRARWFCAADDAFLCQSCDARVHSANPLASRHERVRLKTASFTSQQPEGENESEARLKKRVPSWHSRKARTPRGKQQSSGFKCQTSDGVVRNMFYLVPEVMSDETTSFDESDGQLLYGRVPIFDSLASELCTPTNKAADANGYAEDNRSASASFGANEMKGFVGNFYNDVGFVPSDLDLEEFAADVECLLGKGLEDESFGIDGLGLMEVDDGSTDTTSVRCGRSVMDEEEEEIEMVLFDSSFDYNEVEVDEAASEGGVEKVEVVLDDEEVAVKKRKILLRLDYESILSAWDGSSPWASGTRPEIDPNECCWPTCMATCQIESHQQHMASRMGLSGDGGREARVSRYREKRRTRLFSKKIRYEVRKLNAEKRPRMKGRFVKRPSSFSPTSSVSLLS